MNRITRLLVSITALAVLASACGGADDEAAEAPSTTAAPVTSDADGDGESTETGDAPTTTVEELQSELVQSEESAAATSTEAPTTTSQAPDPEVAYYPPGGVPYEETLPPSSDWRCEVWSLEPFGDLVGVAAFENTLATSEEFWVGIDFLYEGESIGILGRDRGTVEGESFPGVNWFRSDATWPQETALLEVVTYSGNGRSEDLPKFSCEIYAIFVSGSFDDEPPQAPTGLECLGLGGGSGEVILALDAPSDPTDIETIRVYVDEGSGFQRVAKTTTDGAPASVGSVWDLDTTDPTTWSMGVYPVPNFVEISIAVTFGDAAGNESGWNPITVTPTFDGCS